MNSHPFGEHLKREREMRGVSLEEISAATRISVRFLEALENEQWERLPGGIFNRGFIRSVAHFLGLDEEGLIAEYALETRERPEIAVWTKEPVRPRPRWGAILGVILFIVLLLGGSGYVYSRFGGTISAWHRNHPLLKSLLARFQHAKLGVPKPPPGDSSALPVKSHGGSPVPAQATSSGESTKQTQSQAEDTHAAQAGTGNRAGGAQSPSGPAITNASTVNAALELKVEAGETSDVIVVADGKTVFSGRLAALQTLDFHAKKSFTVSSSKSNAVLLELNGHTVPPLGPPGQPGKITLTSDTLKQVPGGDY